MSGVLKDSHKQRLVGVHGVLFSIYREKEGGSPVWMEVQNVEPDKHGLYSVVVGSTTKEGIPPALFAEQKSLWLSMQVSLSGEVEQPRIRLSKTPGGLIASRERVLTMADAVSRDIPTAAAEARDGASTVLPPGADRAPRAHKQLHHLPPPE